MKKLVLSFLLVFSLHYLVAQTLHFNDSLRLSLENIFSLKISEAHALLATYKLNHPENRWVDYEENYSDFLEVYISEDQNLFNKKQDFISQRYNRIADLPDDNPYRLWMMANMNLQWALVRLKFGQVFQAGWSINKAYRQITQNQSLFPDFVPNKLPLGMLHIMIGMVPDQYQWGLKLVSMQGTVTQGKREIYSVLESSLKDPQYSFLKDEALFDMSFMALNLSHNYQEINNLKILLNQVSDKNLQMDFLKAQILMKTGQNDAALHLLDTALAMKGYYPYYFLDYMKGDCLLRKLDFSADNDYAYFLHHFKGVNYVKDAWRKRAWVALLKGDSLGYHRMMDSVLEYGGRFVDADKQAYQEAQRNSIPNVPLLKARVLFDGGYYEEAKSVLDAMEQSPITRDEKLERIYRYARIAHHQNNWPEAKKEYRRTIEEGRYSPSYFVGNSALKLGEIYETEDSLKLAEYYYNLCLQLNFKEYRTGTKGVAKENLSRVQKQLNDQ